MGKFIRRMSLGGVIAAALVAAAPAFAVTPADINGYAMPEGYVADRTIEVTPATKSINVTYGETVRFLVQNGGITQEVIWHFDGLAAKLSLGTLLASPSASVGSSMPAAAGGIPVYVHQGNNPLNAATGGDSD